MNAFSREPSHLVARSLGTDAESTDAHVHADMTIKEKALALTSPVTARPGRYQPTDKVLAFLDRLRHN